MPVDVKWAHLLPEPVRELPADLAAVAVLTALTALSATVPGVRETPVRIVLGLVFVLSLPGYAFVAALFPEAGEGSVAETGIEADGRDAAGTTRSPTDGRGIDGLERVALSIGLSVAISPLIVLVLNFTPWGIELAPILAGVGGFTLVSTAVAARRRRELPPDERFRVPYREWTAAARAELLEPDTGTDFALNVLLVLSVLLAAGSVGFAVAVPKEGESFTESYLLTETDDGDLVADDYPTELVSGEREPIVVGIGNHEHQRVEYTVVIELQDVAIHWPNETATRRDNGSAADLGNGTTMDRSDRAVTRDTEPSAPRIVVERERELGRFGAALAHNRTHHRTVSLRPTTTGERMRLQFMLFRGEAPAEPTVERAYRETHLWVNVTAAP